MVLLWSLKYWSCSKAERPDFVIGDFQSSWLNEKAFSANGVKVVLAHGRHGDRDVVNVRRTGVRVTKGREVE